MADLSESVLGAVSWWSSVMS